MKQAFKVFVVVLCMIVFASSLIGCKSQTLVSSTLPSPDELSLDKIINENVDQVTQSDAKKLVVKVLLSSGGKGDKSFNDLAIAGLDKAVKKYNISYQLEQSRDDQADILVLEKFAKESPDLIIGIGFTAYNPVQKVAADYPHIKFAIVDSAFDTIPANVVCLTFAENNGSFLAGVLAAGMSKSNTVGFIGGMDTPLIHKFELGYIAGAKAYNPNITVLSEYVGKDPSAFGDPVKGKSIAKNQINNRADIIYHAAGGSGNGVFEAVSEEGTGVYAIGVDSNQNWIYPGQILASMLKKVDIAVFETIKSVQNGNFKGGTTTIFDIAQGGVDLTNLNNLTVEETDGISPENQEKIKAVKASIPEELKQSIESYKQKISSGEIVVPFTK